MSNKKRKAQRAKQPKAKSDLWDYIVQTLKVSEKPTWDDVWNAFKVTVIGFLLVGVIGFLFQLTAVYLVGG